MTSCMWLVLLVPLCFACSQAQIRSSNDRWSDGVVVANNMCARDRSTQHTNDPEGQRANCTLEEVLGSHFQKCVCRDERQAAQEREDAQQYMLEASQSRQQVHGN